MGWANRRCQIGFVIPALPRPPPESRDISEKKGPRSGDLILSLLSVPVVNSLCARVAFGRRGPGADCRNEERPQYPRQFLLLVFVFAIAIADGDCRPRRPAEDHHVDVMSIGLFDKFHGDLGDSA